MTTPGALDLPEHRDRLNEIMGAASWKEAIAWASRHEEAVSADFELSWTVGWAYVKLERFDEAIEYLQRAVRLCPSEPKLSAIAYWALGLALREVSRFSEAEDALLRSIDCKSGHLNRLMLGLLYMKMGRADDAEKVHLEGLEERRSAERLESYACFLGDMGRVKEEERILTEARETPREGRGPKDS